MLLYDGLNLVAIIKMVKCSSRKFKLESCVQLVMRTLNDQKGTP